MNKLETYRRGTAAGLALAMAALGLVMAGGAVASAQPPTEVTLNPAPPDSYTCTPIGNGTRCLLDVTTTGIVEDSGIVCGTGADAFEIVDSASRRVKAERWYDREGNLVKRVRANLFSDSRLTNPVTGVFVTYDQHDIDTDLFAVPGDLGSATTYSNEHLIAIAPGYGTVLVNTGRSVYGSDGSVISQTGRRDLDAYFGGDASVVMSLCAALGA